MLDTGLKIFSISRSSQMSKIKFRVFFFFAGGDGKSQKNMPHVKNLVVRITSHIHLGWSIDLDLPGFRSKCIIRRSGNLIQIGRIVLLFETCRWAGRCLRCEDFQRISLFQTFANGVFLQSETHLKNRTKFSYIYALFNDIRLKPHIYMLMEKHHF